MRWQLYRSRMQFFMLRSGRLMLWLENILCRAWFSFRVVGMANLYPSDSAPKNYQGAFDLSSTLLQSNVISQFATSEWIIVLRTFVPHM
jgi:hypothetical protein